MISTVELSFSQQNLKKLERKVLNLIGDKFLLKQAQGNMIKSLQQKDSELQILTDSFNTVKSHLMTMHSSFTILKP